MRNNALFVPNTSPPTNHRQDWQLQDHRSRGDHAGHLILIRLLHLHSAPLTPYSHTQADLTDKKTWCKVLNDFLMVLVSEGQNLYQTHSLIHNNCAKQRTLVFDTGNSGSDFLRWSNMHKVSKAITNKGHGTQDFQLQVWGSFSSLRKLSKSRKFTLCNHWQLSVFGSAWNNRHDYANTYYG